MVESSHSAAMRRDQGWRLWPSFWIYSEEHSSERDDDTEHLSLELRPALLDNIEVASSLGNDDNRGTVVGNGKHPHILANCRTRSGRKTRASSLSLGGLSPRRCYRSSNRKNENAWVGSFYMVDYFGLSRSS